MGAEHHFVSTEDGGAEPGARSQESNFLTWHLPGAVTVPLRAGTSAPVPGSPPGPCISDHPVGSLALRGSPLGLSWWDWILCLLLRTPWLRRNRDSRGRVGTVSQEVVEESRKRDEKLADTLHNDHRLLRPCCVRYLSPLPHSSVSYFIPISQRRKWGQKG